MRTLGEETGQVLVQLALMLVVLLGATALAIDVGRLYRERRQMQNAADAGALAGARALCLDLGSGAATAWAEEYRARNGGEGPVPVIADDVITVIASRVSETFIARAIGVVSTTVRANAAARCGCASGICNAFPVTYEAGAYRWAAQGCGHEFLLWDDGTVNCTDYDCEGLRTVPAVARSWVDFSALLDDSKPDPCDQTGCGNSELRDRIWGKTSGGVDCRNYIKIPGCMAGDNGVKADAWRQVELSAGRVVRIPLWDTVNECEMEYDPGNTCGSMRYHIVTSSCVQILGTKLLRKIDGGPKARVVRAVVLCPRAPGSEKCFSTCGGSGGPVEEGCVRGASLIR